MVLNNIRNRRGVMKSVCRLGERWSIMHLYYATSSRAIHSFGGSPSPGAGVALNVLAPTR